MGFENVGRVWTPQSLAEYLTTRTKPGWATSITMHHTAAPSLGDRPNGFTVQHIRNIESFYKKPKSEKGLGWTSGPHLFIDEDQIFGMCDFRSKGIHAVSFNSSSIGIEVLGYYDKKLDNPKGGRGLQCWKNAAATARVILDWLDLKPNNKTVLFHRDDPETSKTCPGDAVTKEWFLSLIPGKITDSNSVAEISDKPSVGIAWTNWHYAGGRWCVPILEFLTAKGVAKERIIAGLKSNGGKLHLEGEWLESGFYVPKGGDPKPDECSWASAVELLEWLKLA